MFMNQSLTVNFESSRSDEKGIVRNYVFIVPYGAPSDQALSVLEEIKTFLETREAELRNAQENKEIQS